MLPTKLHQDNYRDEKCFGRADAGPPRKSGVLNVVAILEHKPLESNPQLAISHDKEKNNPQGFQYKHNTKRETYLLEARRYK